MERRWWWLEMIVVSLAIDNCSAFAAVGERHERFSWSTFADVASGPFGLWAIEALRRDGVWSLVCMTVLPVALFVAYGITRYRPALYLGAVFWIGIAYIMTVAIWI